MHHGVVRAADGELVSTGRRLIVVGASGLIGRALLAAAAAERRPAVGTYFANPAPGLVPFDLARHDFAAAFPDLGPGDAVILLSARADPNWVFANPLESHELNVDGSLRAIAHTRARGARLVFVSTEIVFDGETGGYAETDRPNPSTLYAQQKVAVEEAIQSGGGSWAIIRTGWTVGWQKDARCPILLSYKTLMTAGARMAEDNVFTLTDVRDTAAALLQLADRHDNDLWHIASAPPVSRTDLADWVIAASRFGSRMGYERVRFAEIPYPEPRPERSWIVNHKAVQNLHLTFAEPWRTVARKVGLIDSWFEASQRLHGAPPPVVPEPPRGPPR